MTDLVNSLRQLPTGPEKERKSLMRMAADEIERLRDEKRDMFAAQALAGFCANTAIFASNEQSGWDLVNCNNRTLAHKAYQLADVMMEVRKPW